MLVLVYDPLLNDVLISIIFITKKMPQSRNDVNTTNKKNWQYSEKVYNAENMFTFCIQSRE